MTSAPASAAHAAQSEKSSATISGEACSSGLAIFAGIVWLVDDVAGTADLVYPDGRIDRHTLDPLGRVRTIDLTTRGTSAGGPSVAAGTTLLRS